MQDNKRDNTATETTGADTGSLGAHGDSFPSLWAKRMGFGGLIPFVLLALAVWLADPAYRSFAGLALLGYGAVIASFLGAIHWGLVMRNTSINSTAVLAWGVSPSLVAWVALMLGAVICGCWLCRCGFSGAL